MQTASPSRAGVSPWQLGRLAPVFPAQKAEHFHRLAIIAHTTKHPASEISWRPERSLESGDAEHGFDTGITVTE